jgi:hypothetical protein
MDRLIGEVTKYVKNGGYCFLLGTDNRSHFLHVKNINNREVPAVGDLFSFALHESTTKPGHQEAFDAVLVKRRSNKPRVVVPAEVEL